MTKKIVIIGTGLFSEVARVYLEELGDYKVIGFACHAEYKNSDSIYGLPLHTIEMLSDIHGPNEVDVFVAIGYKQMNKMRQKVYEEIKSLGYRCISFIHPDVQIWNSTVIGENVFIFENNTIQPFTKIGDNTILWSGNHLGHHSSIGNHCFIASHVVISGYCRIENNVFIGVNATLRDGVSIASETLIGAGAMILKATKSKEVYAPIRTKLFPKNTDEIGF